MSQSKYSANFILIKSILLIFGLFSLSKNLESQTSTAGILFQAIAKDNAGNPANNRNIFIRVSILSNSSNDIPLLVEEHETNTDNLGVFNIAIGKGKFISGVSNSIDVIDWSRTSHQLNLKVAISPVAPTAGWDFHNEWVDLGNAPFGVVPYAMHVVGLKATVDTSVLNRKLNIIDTSKMLSNYAKSSSVQTLSATVNNKVNIADTNSMLAPYIKSAFVMNINLLNGRLDEKVNISDSLTVFVTPSEFKSKIFDTSSLSNRINYKLNVNDTSSISNRIDFKLNILDTNVMLSNRIQRDTIALSNRINLKENISNKSFNVSNVSAYNDNQYPSVKAIKDYVDAAIVAGAPDADINTKGILKLTGDLSGSATNPVIANNSITTIKILDAAVTDAKIAFGINASKVGLGNLTNNAQLYNLNGLTTQTQNFAIPSYIGTAPSWTSSGSIHTLNIPLASASSVTAGLLSKIDFDHFNSAYSTNINSLTTTGSNGTASLSGQILNIPSYSLVGLAGSTSANYVFAGPVSGGMSAASFRTLVAADIPNNASNTTGNANTASKLSISKNINGTAFDGSTDITIFANTPNAISFNNDGLGIVSGGSFNGATPKTISYNTIGAAPSIGSSSITTLGSVSIGTWAASVIDANYGGAGNNNGILKANGLGLVSTAIAGTDYIAPFTVQTSKQFLAAPNAFNGIPVFRSIVDSDIPILNQNTTGNAATASVLENPRLINGVFFDGSSDISIPTNTSNSITFNNGGAGVGSGVTFNGSIAKTISYNTIGAAPSIGSSSITTLGNITTGTWNANVIDARHGGAGITNGIMKADGSGIVSNAIAGTDFQSPLSFQTPLSNSGNVISLPIASNLSSGYLSSIDWNNFNNKININKIGVANGVASLDGTGKIPTSQIPAISFSSGYVVNNETEMLALSSAVVGSIAIRTDNSKNYVLSGFPATTLSNWLVLLMPASVTSVNGFSTGSIVLTTSHISEGTNLYYTIDRAKSAISASSPVVYSSATGIISLPAATTSVAGHLTAADWNTFNNKLGTFASQAPSTFFAGPASGVNASPVFRTMEISDVPVLNQNTSGNAATATKLAVSKNINGIAFDGSADITIASTIANAITFNNSGIGLSSPTSFDGSLAKTISYNTIGAAPSIGSANITTLGTITTGTWNANVIDASHGGAGAVNGILKSDGNGNVTNAVAGSDYQIPFGSQTNKYFYAAPNAANGSPIFRSILVSDIPTLNQSTSGNAATATKLAATKNINGVAFDGSADIAISSNITNAITFDNSGTGALSSSSFNGAVAKTISYNTIGAAPAIGSTSIVSLGTVTSGTWSANIIDASHGGAGANNGILKANGLGVVATATAGTDFENALTFVAPLSRTLNTISMPSATISSNGFLTSTDWNTFNGKQSSLVAGIGISISGGNTVAIGQTVATTSNPIFAGITLSGLNVSGIVTNTAAGLLSTTSTTGAGNIVRSTSPILVTPLLGDASATSISTGTITATSSITSNGDMTAKRFKLTMPSAITAATTTTIDLSTGNVYTVNVGLNITTLTLNNPVVGTYLIKFLQVGTGNWSITFPTGWKWAGGVVPSITPTTGKLDIVTLIYDGTNYYATIVKNF